MIKRLLRRIILWALHDPIEERRKRAVTIINARNSYAAGYSGLNAANVGQSAREVAEQAARLT